ncbi:MAG: HAD family hydrolase [Clostridia bacterium]|nr:HAD family hydrolase [Clostridia bacterium]
MKNYKNILFDLDGTLINPKEGITNSVKYALEYFGIKVKTTEELYKFIGPPLRESFSQYYRFNEKDTEMAITKYREYFKEKGVFQNVLYKGVPELLNKLVSENKNLIIATSKAEVFAKQILDNLDISKYFSFICGSTLDGTRSKKGEVIQYILSSTNLNPEDSVMIGDKSHDIIGAKQTKLDSIGVLYGYGNYTELQNAGATYIVKNITELQAQLLAN